MSEPAAGIGPAARIGPEIKPSGGVQSAANLPAAGRAASPMPAASLLPPNATDAERAIEAAIARAAEVPVPIRATWNADTCPAHLLPWLAWAFSVDEWDAAWPELAKRAAIRDAVAIQRRKGTVWAIRRVLDNAGYGDARLIEGNGANDHDGQSRHNEQITHGDPKGWARFRFNLSRPIRRGEGQRIRAMLATVAPVRCHLLDLSFTDAQFYNGEYRHDAEFNHGAA